MTIYNDCGLLQAMEMGRSITPMILFKAKGLKQEFTDNLPRGSLIKMAPKGTMTMDLFSEFLKHLS